MLAIPCPDDDAGLVFAACANRTRNADLRAALIAQRPRVEARAALYLRHADLGTLFDLPMEDTPHIDRAELAGLYGRVMVNGGERTRYLKLRGSSRYNRCPSCGQRDVKTLDHYLSKDDYPELAVFPANLVPCCFECNHAKLNYRAEEAEDQLFHPYFDDWSEYCLVRATIDIGARVTVSFAIRSPAEVDQEVILRARKHFEKLALDDLYAQQAAVELVGRKLTFRSTFEADGEEGLRDELALEARSRQRANINSWQYALYRALSRSNAFCSGGFEQIDEP